MSEGLGYAGGDNTPLRGRSKTEPKIFVRLVISGFIGKYHEISKRLQTSQFHFSPLVVIVIKSINCNHHHHDSVLGRKGDMWEGGCRVPAFISGSSVNVTGTSHAMVTIFIIILMTMTMTMTISMTMTI